jgi:O-methyltransferase
MSQVLSRIRNRVTRQLLGGVAKSALRDRLTYLSPRKLWRLERALAGVVRANIAGDLVEFGTALGGSGLVIASRAAGRNFHGFDVFSMIPPPTSPKDDQKSKQRYEDIKSGASAGLGGDVYYGYRPDLYAEVKATFARYGTPVDGARVRLHQGLFEETWPAAAIDRLALAHVDCDWYDPVAFVLGAIADRMSPGGLVIIDDYNDYGGCRTAVDEFIAKRDDFVFSPGLNPILRKRA